MQSIYASLTITFNQHFHCSFTNLNEVLWRRLFRREWPLRAPLKPPMMKWRDAAFAVELCAREHRRLNFHFVGGEFGNTLLYFFLFVYQIVANTDA
jgi:hypothetical protein